MFEHLRRRKDNPRKNKKKVWHLPQSSRNRKQTFSAEKKPAAATLPNDGTMGMMQRPKRLSILTTCKTCLLSIKEHLLNLLTQRNNLQKKKKKKTRKQLCMSLEKIQYSWAFQPSKKVFSIGLYLVGKRQENLSKEAKK